MYGIITETSPSDGKNRRKKQTQTLCVTAPLELLLSITNACDVYGLTKCKLKAVLIFDKALKVYCLRCVLVAQLVTTGNISASKVCVKK